MATKIGGEGAASNCGVGGTYCLEDSGTSNILFGSASCGDISTGTSFTPLAKTWYNIVATYNSIGSNYIYVNNKQDASGTVALCNDAVNFQMGSDGNADYLSGNIANLQLYDTSLTAAQIAQIYQSGIAGVPIASANIIGWWPLNGDANDYSGHIRRNGVANSVSYPYFSGTYNSPGLSAIATSANEWQALGLANT